MAEFCLECWRRINGTTNSKKQYILSEDLDLCEGCGVWKQVVIMERSGYSWVELEWADLLMSVFCEGMHLIWKLLILPYTIYKYCKSKRKRN